MTSKPLKLQEAVSINGVVFVNRSAAALHYGLLEKTVIARLKYGWTIDDAYMKPARKW